MPGYTRSPALSLSEQIGRLGGVDVAQLLRDIGDSSACTDPVELFRLCLQAQRVLADVQTGCVPAATAATAALLASFHAMDSEGQDRLTTFSRQLQTRFPRQRAALTLVKSGQAKSMEAV